MNEHETNALIKDLFDIDEVVEYFDGLLMEIYGKIYPRYTYTGDSCSSCKKTINIPDGGGWICPSCGEFNCVSWHCHQFSWENPDIGPSKKNIFAGFDCAKNNFLKDYPIKSPATYPLGQKIQFKIDNRYPEMKGKIIKVSPISNDNPHLQEQYTVLSDSEETFFIYNGDVLFGE